MAPLQNYSVNGNHQCTIDFSVIKSNHTEMEKGVCLQHAPKVTLGHFFQPCTLKYSDTNWYSAPNISCHSDFLATVSLLHLQMSIRWMWRCHIIPFCAARDEFWFNFPADNAQISPRSVTSSKLHSQQQQQWWQLILTFRSVGLLSSTFVKSKMFPHSWDSFCQLRKWGIKILLCFPWLSIQHTNDSLLEITDGDVSQTPPDFSSPECCFTVGLSTAVKSLEQSERDDFRSVCHQPLGCNPSAELMGTLLNQWEKQVPDFTLNQAAT